MSSVVHCTYGRAARTSSATPCSAHHSGELTAGVVTSPKTSPHGQRLSRRSCDDGGWHQAPRLLSTHTHGTSVPKGYRAVVIRSVPKGHRNDQREQRKCPKENSVPVADHRVRVREAMGCSGRLSVGDDEFDERR